METELDIFSGESVKPTETPEQTKQPEPAVVAPKAIEATLFGEDLFGNHCAPAADGALKKRFLIPPFSVLNAREGVWQDRKRAWISLGIKSELGRGGMAATGGVPAATASRAEPSRAEPSRAEPSRAEPNEASDVGDSTEREVNDKRQRLHRASQASPGGSCRPACDYSKRQRGDGTGKPIV